MLDLDKLVKATLVLLMKDGEVLLAMKKRGFGMGKWNGSGGKVKEGETFEQAAIREAEEEIGVKIKSMKKVGVMKYYFPLVPVEKRWNCEVHVFMSREWIGTPTESEEMRPKWFKFSEIPYEQMWSDDMHWLPIVLAGKTVETKFTFGEKEEVLTQEVKIS